MDIFSQTITSLQYLTDLQDARIKDLEGVNAQLQEIVATQRQIIDKQDLLLHMTRESRCRPITSLN